MEENTNKKNKIKKIILIIIAIGIVGMVGVLCWYNISLSPVSNQSEEVEIEIELGSFSNKIANVLNEKGLIKTAEAFTIYARLNNISDFQAGKYTLNKNMSVNEIVEVLKTGKLFNKNNISITFLEGKNIRWYANKIEESTNNKKEDFYNLLSDDEYLDELIDKYWFLTDKIKDENIYYSLEGYLYPDTYSFNDKNITVKEIIEKLLDQTKEKLEKYKQSIQSSKYSVHEILTMASIIELEGVYDSDKKDIASVFYNRLENNMSLGSDVTTYYAAKVEVGERDLYQNEINQSNLYNTRGPNMAGKLPIGPISSVSESSIEAAIYPNSTDYFYFVADKDGKVYFTKNYTEHNKKITELKNSGLWYEF